MKSWSSMGAAATAVPPSPVSAGPGCCTLPPAAGDLEAGLAWAAAGGATVDAVGRIVDFSLIKKRLLGWLDAHWDHAFILFSEDAEAIAAVRASRPSKLFLLPWNPTAENIARLIYEKTKESGFPVVEVKLWETESCNASYRA